MGGGGGRVEVGANSKLGDYSFTGFCEHRLEFHTADSASDCLKICFNQSETLPMPDPGTVASSDGISALVPRSSFHRETNGGVAKCRLFSQA